ncbi:MAG: Ig-like domain repeat protein, partial [Clostridia bacterium]|nr:Ig-like domain repeat protein [Clostridia bacterium]
KVLEISNNYSKDVVLGDEFTVPSAKFEGTAVTAYTVKTPSGSSFTNEDVTDGKFKIEEIGTYTITYTVGANGEYTGSFSFVSSVSSYSIKLNTNNDKILPAKVGMSDSTENFYVPTYVVTDKNGEEVTEGVTVKVTVTTPDFKTLQVNDGKINFGSETLKKGTYIVNYAVYMGSQYLTSTKQEFRCVVGTAYEENKELVVSYSKEKPENVNIGKSITLPAVTAKVGAESVPVYYTVEVYKNGTEKVDGSVSVGNTETKVLEQDEQGNYVFTANEVANFYTVKYTVKTARGGKETVTQFNIDTVEDSLKPTPIVVEAYETNATKDLVDVSEKLASNFNDEDIKILAVYAEDLGTFHYADYKFKREIKNSSYEVVYTDETNANKNILFNYSGDASTLTGEEDFVVAKDKNGEEITLNDGTYYAYYTATDKAGNSSTVNYKFVVKAGFDGKTKEGDVVAPVVTVNDIFYKTVNKGEEISFGKVTFSDDNDARLETSVYYEYKNAANEVVETKELELNANNKYVIDTSKAPETAAKVAIYAKAINDTYYVAPEAEKENFVTVEELAVVGINSKITDAIAPIVTAIVVNAGETKENVGSVNEDEYIYIGNTIKLPTITFYDGIIDTLDTEISITCVSGTGNDKKEIAYEAQNAIGIRTKDSYVDETITSGTYMLSNASFVAATEGIYTVSIKATDAAGNVVVRFLNYEVKDESYVGALRFTNIGLTDTTIELGETFKLPTANIAGTGKDDYRPRVKCTQGPTGYKLNEDRFTPSKVGEYTLVYEMFNINTGLVKEGEEVEVKVTVQDKTNPEIYVNWQTTILDNPEVENTTTGEEGKETIVKADPIEIGTAYEKGVKILLPMLSAQDLSGLDVSKSMVTITNSSTSSTRTIKFADMAEEYAKGENGDMYYTFSRDGEYNITYTVYDKQGNSSKKSFTVKVGDLEAPEFEVSEDVIKDVKLNGNISFDLASDDKNWFDLEEGIDKSKIKAVLTVNGTEVKNSETENGKYSFDLTEAGEYVLTFTVKDAAGNETEVVKNFTIADKGEDAMSTEQIIGTVLIVLTVVVLAGVVVYFVVTKRKMDKLYK